MKSFPEKPAGKLKPNKATSTPWKDITTDFIIRLPEAQGYDALFITCCHHTKQAHIILTTMETSARGLAALFRDHVLWNGLLLYIYYYLYGMSSIFSKGLSFILSSI